MLIGGAGADSLIGSSGHDHDVINNSTDAIAIGTDIVVGT